MSVKRKCFSVEEKMEIIRRLEAGERNASLSKEFCVCHTTIATIHKNKEKIKALFNNNILKAKRVRASTQDQVDKALLQWSIMQRSRGIPLSGPLLQEKANFFAKQFKIENFNCSVSWISRFKVRHNIVAGKVSGESLSVQKSDVSEYLTKVCPKQELDEYVLYDNGEVICEEPFEEVLVKKEEQDEYVLYDNIEVFYEEPSEDVLVKQEELNEYVPIDNGVAFCEEPSENSRVKNILDYGQDSDDNVDQNAPSVLDAFKAAEILNKFVHSNFNDESLMHCVSRINNAVSECFYMSKTTAKQTKITDYFN